MIQSKYPRSSFIVLFLAYLVISQTSTHLGMLWNLFALHKLDIKNT